MFNYQPLHEDHDMMAAFDVTQADLSTFGYPETVSFNDPMAPEFRAKPYSGTSMATVQDVMLPGMQNLDAYPNAKDFEKSLDDYYKNPPSSFKSSSVVTSTTAISATNTVPSTLVTSTTPASPATTSKAITPKKSEDKPKTTTTAKATITKKK